MPKDKNNDHIYDLSAKIWRVPACLQTTLGRWLWHVNGLALVGLGMVCHSLIWLVNNVEKRLKVIAG
jgi:hypothetical protein